jgi:hypothetical protein
LKDIVKLPSIERLRTMTNFVVEVDRFWAAVAVLWFEVNVAEVGHHVRALLQQ